MKQINKKEFMNEIEKKTKIPKFYVFVAVSAVLFFFVILNLGGSLITFVSPSFSLFFLFSFLVCCLFVVCCCFCLVLSCLTNFFQFFCDLCLIVVELVHASRRGQKLGNQYRIIQTRGEVRRKKKEKKRERKEKEKRKKRKEDKR